VMGVSSGVLPQVPPEASVAGTAALLGIETPVLCCIKGVDRAGTDRAGVVAVVHPLQEKADVSYRGLLLVNWVLRELVRRCGNQDVFSVEVLRHFLELVQEASCGRCIPCRLGTRRMLEYVSGLVRGTAVRFSPDELAAMARFVGVSSRCDLGRIAGKLVANTVCCYRRAFERYPVQEAALGF